MKILMLIHNNKSSTTHTKCRENDFYFGQNKKNRSSIVDIARKWVNRDEENSRKEIVCRDFSIEYKYYSQ